MNILYHHRTMGRGAEGIHIASMVRAFEGLGHKVIVLSPPGVDPMGTIGQRPLDKSTARATGLDLLWRTVSKHAPQIVFELMEVLYNFKAIAELRRTVKAVGIDLLYERNAYFLFAGALTARRYGVPLVVEANEVVGVRRARKLRLKWLARLVEKYTLRRSHAVMVVSSFLKEKADNVVKGKVPVLVTPNAVDPALFERDSERDRIRRQLNISDKTVLGFVGWFDWWDRLDLMVDLQKQLLDMGHKNVATLLIGDGPMMNDLKERAKRLGVEDSVIFTGPVDRAEVLDYIDAIDIGVLPHSNEFGSPVVLFEMMALGKPVVAPSLMPMTDVVTHGVNGLLFQPLSGNGLLSNILALLNAPDDRKRIGNSASEMVKERHTWSNNAQRAVASVQPCQGDS